MLINFVQRKKDQIILYAPIWKSYSYFILGVLGNLVFILITALYFYSLLLNGYEPDDLWVIPTLLIGIIVIGFKNVQQLRAVQINPEVVFDLKHSIIKIKGHKLPLEMFDKIEIGVINLSYYLQYISMEKVAICLDDFYKRYIFAEDEESVADKYIYLRIKEKYLSKTKDYKNLKWFIVSNKQMPDSDGYQDFKSKYSKKEYNALALVKVNFANKKVLEKLVRELGAFL